jgi:hypothetical protein
MSRTFGAIRQIAFIVRDLDAARDWDRSDPVREIPSLVG